MGSFAPNQNKTKKMRRNRSQEKKKSVVYEKFSLGSKNHPLDHPGSYVSKESSQSRDGGKINFFDFLSIRPILSIINKKCHLSIKNRFCLELQKS